MQSNLIEFMLNQLIKDEKFKERVMKTIEKIIHIEERLQNIENKLIEIYEKMDLIQKEKNGRQINLERRKKFE